MIPASIIIPAWNGAQWITNCLRSVEMQLHPDDEVVVVDNGSADGTPDLVAREFPHVRLIRLERNLGFAGGINRGLEAARGDVLILINQDVVLREGCLDALRRQLAEGGSGVIGCKLLYPDERTIQHAGGIVRYPRAEPDHYGYRLRDDGRWDAVKPVDYVTGAVFAFDRVVWRAAGSFDEEFFPAYYEEVDYCFRVRAAGFRVTYEPSAVAIHYESQSQGSGSAAYHRAMQRGRLRFALKHYQPEQLLADFFPAERDYMRGASPSFVREALAPAYFSTLLSAPGLFHSPAQPMGTHDTSSSPRQSPVEIIAELSELWLLARGVSNTNRGDMDDESHSRHLPILHEHDFRSSAPIAGRFIQWVRRGLYGLTAKWGVRVVIDQQNQINQTIVQYMQEYEARLSEDEARLIEQDRDLARLSRLVAELEIRQRQLTKMIDAQTGESH